jgi:predicted tellurium resistance membrane protein TerC
MDQLASLLTDPKVYASLAVLSLMEIVLGIDNIVFISILTGRLPKERQLGARRLGLAVALVSRLALLGAIAWVMRLKDTLFTVVVPFSGKDLILIGGGLFLLYKATHEIFVNVEHPEQPERDVEKTADDVVHTKPAGRATYVGIILQILVLDIVFSLDSVITAVGMAQHVPVMVVAMLIAVGVMLTFAGPIGDFIQKHPSVRVLALAFLVLIGVMLVIEGTGGHVSKGYIYSAMGFSLFVQMLNIRMDARARRLQRA